MIEWIEVPKQYFSTPQTGIFPPARADN